MTSTGGSRRTAVVLGQLGPLVERGLSQIIDEDKSLRLAGIGVSDAELERAIAQWQPKVAILDSATVVEPSSLRHLRDEHPAVGVVVLAHLPSRVYGAQLIAAGISCLSTGASVADILAAIHHAAQGEHTLVLPQDPRREGQMGPRSATLTRRERQVLDGMCRGLSYGQIAGELGIATETARTHAAGVRRKLGVSRKTAGRSTGADPARAIAARTSAKRSNRLQTHPNITRKGNRQGAQKSVSCRRIEPNRRPDPVDGGKMSRCLNSTYR
jgi:DNA-binding NarL/FixJ family response regulator